MSGFSSNAFWEQARIAATSAAHFGVSAAGAVAGAAGAVQDTIAHHCCVCGTAVLRPAMFQCSRCRQDHCRNCRVVVTGPTDRTIASSEESMRLQISACKNCENLIREELRSANIQERMLRVDAFLQGRLTPYMYTPEGKLDKALRLGGHAMTGLKQVVGFLPIGQIANVVKAGYYLVRYGPLILSSNDFVEIFQLLVSLASLVECDRSRLASPDFFGGLYYMMGEHWGERSKMPELEFQEHVGQDGRVPEPDAELLRHLHFMNRLLLVSKEPTAPDMQRLLKQAVPHAEVVLAETASGALERAHLLVCDRHNQAAYLILPGTSTVADFAADFNADCEEVGCGAGHRGMVQSARWLQAEFGPVLENLSNQGYAVTVVGHSLGAGVGAIFSLLMRDQIPTLRCYGFGTPACIDERLIPALRDIMCTVVNRDDMVPRLSVHTVQHLVHTVLCPGQVAKTRSWMNEDMQAIKDVERVVELRRRQAGQASGPSSSPSHADLDEEKVAILVEAGIDRAVAVRVLREENGDVSLAMLKATEEQAATDGSNNDGNLNANTNDCSASAAASTAAPSDAPGQGPASSPSSGGANSQSAFVNDAFRRFTTATSGYFDSAGGLAQSAMGFLNKPGDGASRPPRARPTRMFLPGQIVHLYRRNGIARAAWAAPEHGVFDHITICKDMLNDHNLSAYSEALHQAQIRESPVNAWEPFDSRKVCACCEAEFNWAFVLQSEPQRLLARHHCFCCGRAVCDGCSRKRLAHPDLGHISPVRTCDACFFNRTSHPEHIHHASGSGSVSM